MPSKEPKKFSDFLFVLFSGVHFKAIGMLDKFRSLQQQQNQTKAQSNGPRDLRQNPEATVMTNFFSVLQPKMHNSYLGWIKKLIAVS